MPFMKIEDIYRCFTECTAIATDTRKIEPGSMFVALKGENFDANTFTGEALDKGARYVMIDNKDYYTGPDTILVEDSLTALQRLANYHRRHLGLPVIALTGSNGKTTTKELINAVLLKKYNVKATIGNLNNHIGVPLTLLSFTGDTEIGIVEMGANHQKEISALCEIAEPNFGYITNFGKAHLEGFGGVEGVIKGKSELYDYLAGNTKMAFVNLDDTVQKEKTQNLPRYTFAVSEYNCDVRIENTQADPMVTITYNGIDIYTNLIGKYNAPNISAAIAIGNYFKISDTKIKEAIEGYVPSNNRSQLMEKNGHRIILDAYNANPSSMAAAIENFVRLEAKNKIAILGDMFELGEESPAEHKKIIALLQDKPAIISFFIGKDFNAWQFEDTHLHFYKDFESFKENFTNHNVPPGSLLLIKGSRGMALERALELF